MTDRPFRQPPAPLLSFTGVLFLHPRERALFGSTTLFQDMRHDVRKGPGHLRTYINLCVCMRGV